jgi:signal transduction histidine kinase
VEDVRRTGIDVALTLEGPARPLDAGIELTAYRIVQESLTNVLKHSGASHAQVRLTYAHAGLDVEVRDDGRAGRTAPVQPEVASGHGLVGLRERTRLLGGALEYGAIDGAGFRVAAHLPSSEQVAS